MLDIVVASTIKGGPTAASGTVPLGKEKGMCQLADIEWDILANEVQTLDSVGKDDNIRCKPDANTDQEI